MDNKEIDVYIKELMDLRDMDMLPEETKTEIDSAIKFAEGIKTATGDSPSSKIPIKFINKSELKNPTYAKLGDSGFDLRANEGGSLKPLERKLVPTGLFFELPEGYELQVRPRSGMALKHGITVLNTPGTVDTNYRGEVGIILVNLSNKEYSWEKGERIAQGVVAHRLGTEYSELIEVNEITETERGSDGFGSTGTK